MSRILQVTDLHFMAEPTGTLLGVNTEHYFRQVLLHAQQHHAPFDLILLTGDLAQDTCAASYTRIREIIDSYPAPCIALPGNHDDLALMQEHLSGNKIKLLTTLQLSGWKIICLNSQLAGSAAGYLSAQELSRLQVQLNATPSLPALIALHHHCISSGSRWMDTMKTQNAQDLLDILSQHPQVKAVLFGHVHQHVDETIASIRYLGTPASCFQFKPGADSFALDDKPPGYRVIELEPDGSVTTHVDWLSVTLDELNPQGTGY